MTLSLRPPLQLPEPLTRWAPGVQELNELRLLGTPYPPLPICSLSGPGVTEQSPAGSYARFNSIISQPSITIHPPLSLGFSRALLGSWDGDGAFFFCNWGGQAPLYRGLNKVLTWSLGCR